MGISILKRSSNLSLVVGKRAMTLKSLKSSKSRMKGENLSFEIYKMTKIKIRNELGHNVVEKL